MIRPRAKQQNISCVSVGNVTETEGSGDGGNSFLSPTLHRLHFSVISTASRLTLAGALATSLPQPDRGSSRPQPLLYPLKRRSSPNEQRGEMLLDVSLWLVDSLFSPIFVRWLAVVFSFFLTTHISLGAILQQYPRTNELAICNSVLFSRYFHHMISRELTLVGQSVKGDTHRQRRREDQVDDGPP